MNTRQVATGTVLTAALLFGGAGLADARPNTGAMDRGEVPCEDLLDRVDGLQNAVDHMEARRARLDARLADAQADGDARRVRRLEHQIAQVDRVVDRLQTKIDRVRTEYDERCAPQNT